ncbi:MAG: hypothetical protein AAGK78_10750, partial [Planctomycetota bacterium]
MELPTDPATWNDDLLAVPARWCVYLLAGANDEPVQLLCAKNARASIRRRLAGDDADEPTKRVNLRGVVRRVYWQRVDSDFEQDLVYLEASRATFPDTYAAALGFRPAWFVHANPATTYPRFTRSATIDKQTGQWLGP